MNEKRARLILDRPNKPGPVIYWMSRDQRVSDNWAFLFAQEMAVRMGVAVAVVFCLVPTFGDATMRQYSFMFRGLKEVSARLYDLRIPFFLLSGSPEDEIPAFLRSKNAGALVTDFDPLRIKRKWKSEVARRVDIPIYEVDAHNIVPCWVASDKQEYGAYTFRPRISRLLPEFMDDFAQIAHQQIPWPGDIPEIDWQKAEATISADRSVKETSWLEPGEAAAERMLIRFISEKLPQYPLKRNEPSLDWQSHLSPYLHFGQISAQRVALSIDEYEPGGADFLEELITRRELSDNFCFYNDNYDSVEGFPDWARMTLEKHRHDPKPVIYTLDDLQNCATHDLLWNAGQRQMMDRGKMHGYVRMYWAKKILEWTESPEEALQICTYLNDRYELDGRDPNGHTGIAWSIGGVHDRAWGERPIFGKIRYMSYDSARRKFDLAQYVA